MKIKTIILFLLLTTPAGAQESVLESFDNKNIAVFNEIIRKADKALSSLTDRVATIDTAVTSLDPVASVKVDVFTIDTTTASGPQTISTTGFKPTGIEFFYTQNASQEVGFGFSDGTNGVSVYKNADGAALNWNMDSSSCIFDDDSSGNSYSATLASFNAGGFTLNWTKTGLPTGILTIGYRAFR